MSGTPVLSPINGVWDQTVEDLTLTVDPGSGSDPAVPRRLHRQKEIDARGSFATLAAAVDAIPSHVRHNVTVELADGDYTIDNIPSFERFIFPQGIVSGVDASRISLVSASRTERPSGAPSTYAVTSGADTSFTLVSDPGFSANQFRGFFASVVSGTGAGQLKAIRSHSGVGPWETVGRWNPNLDGTSVVEILQPAARVTVTNPVPGIAGKANEATAQFHREVVINGIDFLVSAASFYLQGVSIDLELVRIFGATTYLYGGVLWNDSVSALVIDSGQLYGIYVYGGNVRFQSGSVLIRNATSHGVVLISSGEVPSSSAPRGYFLGGIAIDDVGGDAIRASGPGVTASVLATATQPILGSNVTGHFVMSDRLAEVDFFAGFDTLLPSGTAGDILHDGVSTPYATLAGDADQAIVGQRGSLIRV